ncbi:MAG: hypothetical protein BXU00_00545 [Candidatus Nanoclepta minutus]|uniref:Uncharacterized protein n=1 Tax=Candidatus Nanoclepta minutus TaxID=1940235 RepID=A0A397WNV2_9ARCH|nr:MAG: hypothetical protein BXU00_00545 [Candidatus Nanoclepta minutus]
MKYSVEREEEAFITVDGRKLYTLQDFLIWLNTCSEEKFRYHVNERENHFVNWIRYSLKLEELAREIENVRDKNRMVDIVSRYIEGEKEILEII